MMVGRTKKLEEGRFIQYKSGYGFGYVRVAYCWYMYVSFKCEYRDWIWVRAFICCWVYDGLVYIGDEGISIGMRVSVCRGCMGDIRSRGDGCCWWVSRRCRK